MDEVDAVVPRTRRQRPKDSFQNELQAKLSHRKTMGLSTDITDSEEDTLGSPSDYLSRAARPTSAKRRPDRSPDLTQGLGTTTMRSRDLTQLLNRSATISDDEDEEVRAANLGRSGSGRLPTTLKTPSPIQDKGYMRKTPTRDSPKEQSNRLDSLFGRKTPTKEASPRGTLSKEEMIFGRKTPTIDGKKSPSDGSKRLPSMEERQWQPPSFRTVSPSSTEHSRGSRGVTPVDSALDPISETPREKVTPRLQRGGDRLTSGGSPQQLSYGERPKPQARGSIGERRTPPLGERKTPPLGERKTPPLVDPRRKSPGLGRTDSDFGRKDTSLKRTTPTMDLFGKSRATAAQEVDEYIGEDKDRDGRRQLGRKTPDSKRLQSMSPEIKGRVGAGSRDKTPERQVRGKFPVDGRKTSPARKTPTELSRRTPQDKRSLEEDKGRKTPDPDRRDSLMDFVLGDSAAKPKPRLRKTKEDEARNDLDDMFSSNRKPAIRSRMADGRESPERGMRKSSEGQVRKPSVEYADRQKSADPFDALTEKPKTIPKQRPEDTSSLCEEIPPDPNRKKALEQAKGKKSNQTERSQADNIIDMIANEQHMSYIEPAKKMRPFTAQAKVQHRPKPRYGTLPGQKSMSPTERQFNSTGDIRDAIYEEWYRERLKAAKKKKKEEERKAAAEEEKKKKETMEKKHEAEMSYRAWTERKKETTFKEKARQKHKEQLKEEKELEEKHEQKIESIKSFESWKEKKDAMIKRELQRKRDKEEEAEERKREEERLKKKDRETAFRGWKTRKEKEDYKKALKMKEEKRSLSATKHEEELAERNKKKQAYEQYLRWMDNKEKQMDKEKKMQRRKQLMDDDDYKPAWSPASRTVPFGR